MSGSVNKVTLLGSVGRDPEIRSMADGKEIANLSVATSERWTDKNTGEKKEKTEWNRVVVFNQHLVGVVKNYVKKGSRIFLEGSLQTRKYTDKDGVEKYSTEIVLQNFKGELVLLDSKGSGAGDGKAETDAAYAKAGKALSGSSGIDESDPIPF